MVSGVSDTFDCLGIGTLRTTGSLVVEKKVILNITTDGTTYKHIAEARQGSEDCVPNQINSQLKYHAGSIDSFSRAVQFQNITSMLVTRETFQDEKSQFKDSQE